METAKFGQTAWVCGTSIARLMKRRLVIVGCLALLAGMAFYLDHRAPSALVLTGLVTTEDVIVSPQVSGQLSEVRVREGDHVERGQVLAVLAAGELNADHDFFSHSEQGSAELLHESEAALRYQEQQTAQQIREAEASLAGAVAQREEAAAHLAHATTTLERDELLLQNNGLSRQEVDEARTARSVAQSRLAAAEKQIDAAHAAVSLARAAAQTVAAKRSALDMAEAQHAAATAQTAKAAVRLGYAELHAPLAGIVDVRAARAGEVVAAGQPVLTLLDLDDLWVRADVEESYIDRVRLGDQLSVRLPSGERRMGTVFYRAVDAEFATQRDVSRTKRDIKTFQIRLRLDNRDRKLAVGMTAYVDLPLVKSAS